MNGLFEYDEVEIAFKGNTWTHLFVFNDCGFKYLKYLSVGYQKDTMDEN
jgi:hypothetical protein